MTRRQQWFVAACTAAMLALIVLILSSCSNEARVTFNSCAEAREAGAPLPLHQGDVGWNAKLDRDGDGAAC